MIYGLIPARIQTNPRRNLAADLWAGTRNAESPKAERRKPPMERKFVAPQQIESDPGPSTSSKNPNDKNKKILLYLCYGEIIIPFVSFFVSRILRKSAAIWKS